MSQQTPQFQQEEEINLREEFEKYIRYWPWFIGCVLICVSTAFLYLRYTTPVYQSTATIIIKDEKKGGVMSELAAFEDMGLFSGMGSNSLENEMGILRSKRLMTDVVRKLGINTRYFQEGNIRITELYENKPIEIQFLQVDEQKLQSRASSYIISETRKKKLLLIDQSTEENIEVSYGEPLSLYFGTLVINKSDDSLRSSPNNPPAFPLIVNFSSVENIAGAYRGAVQVNLPDKNSSLIEISLNDPVSEKARDILDQLILEYNRQAIEDKNLVARNTAKFIEDRLSIITGELDSVETGKEEFKESNRLTDIQAESQLYVQSVGEFKKRRQEVATQIELSNAMLEYINKENNIDLLPANLGISESGVNSVISEYNSLVLERNRILSGSTERNPVVVDLNAQLGQIRSNVIRSLQRMRSNLLISQEELDRQTAQLGSQIADVPGMEKQFRGIARQQNIKEALYLFLLQKREETSLSLAVTAPKAKIVDSAYSSKNPVSPKSKIILLAALIIGVIVPFLFIYLRNLLNNKVQNRGDLEKQSREIPLVVEIPRMAKNQKEIIESNDRSVLAESFRILHTNLQYLLVNAGKTPGGNIVFVTSTIKGEGKTFVAYNLALTLASANKKTLIVGADLRNPQFQRFEAGVRQHKGLSDYLVNPGLNLKEVIKKSGFHHNLDLLVSGSVPPNPAELWRLDRAPQLFDELRSQYDYIIVDTAPAMLVTDTFLINEYADLTLYLVRAGYTQKNLLPFAVEAKAQGKLKEVGYILNDVEAAQFGYGNKYGYYYAYGEDRPGFWDKLKGKAAMW